MVMGAKHVQVVLLPVIKRQKQHRERPNYLVSIPRCFTMQLIPVKCFLHLQVEYRLLVRYLSSHRAAPSGSCLPPPPSQLSCPPSLPLTSLPSPDLPSSSSRFLFNTLSLSRYSCTYLFRFWHHPRFP